MRWFEKCLSELTQKNLFETDEHRSRFRDLLECYAEAPFFTKGLCKCMYLSAWDDEHFAVMLDVLNDMTIDKHKNLDVMKDHGEIREAETISESCSGELNAEHEVWKLSNSFLTGEEYDQSSLPVLKEKEPDKVYMIEKAILMGKVIDSI